MVFWQIPLKRSHGFTLIELMIVLVIMGILLALASPSLSRFVLEQRLKNASFELQSALMLARSTAINRGVGLPSQVSVASKSSTVNWASGWSVVSGGVVIAETGAFERLSITATTSGLAYQGDGRVGATHTFSFTVPDDSRIKGRCVRIDPIGMPFSKTTAEGSC